MGKNKSLMAEFDGYKWHPPLAVAIDGFWHFPRALLPERLKQLFEADRDLRAHWDGFHPHERQRLVIQLDARRDPASPDAQDESDEDTDFEREARRWELETERDQHRRRDPLSSIDLEVKRLALARIAADLTQLDAELAALDSEQADAEQQSDPAGQLTTANTKVEPLAEAARYTDSAKGIEAPRERQDRRLARLRELGGEARQAGGEAWQFSAGKRGALARLIREESDAGRRMAKPSDLRRELARAADREMKGDL